jgi:hypothetical protein
VSVYTERCRHAVVHISFPVAERRRVDGDDEGPHSRLGGSAAFALGDAPAVAPHTGVDLAAKPGEEVRAAAGGKVLFAGANDETGLTVLVGQDAVACGLVDEVGSIDHALARLRAMVAERADSPDRRPRHHHRSPKRRQVVRSRVESGHLR